MQVKKLLPLLKSLLLPLLFFVFVGCSHKMSALNTSPHSVDSTQSPRGATKLSNLSFDMLTNTGNRYMEAGQFQLAHLHYLQALNTNPKSDLIHAQLGNLFLEIEQLTQASSFFMKALELNQFNIQALAGLGRIAHYNAQYEDAENLLLRANSYAPENAYILTELAVCYDAAGKADQAEPLYARVTELLPNNPATHNNSGFNYLIQGKHELAVTHFKTALSMKPNNKTIRNNLAAAYILTNKENLGLSLFEETIGKAEAFNNLGYIYSSMGKHQKATGAFRKALALKPSYYRKASNNLEHLKNSTISGFHTENALKKLK